MQVFDGDTCPECRDCNLEDSGRDFKCRRCGAIIDYDGSITVT